MSALVVTVGGMNPIDGPFRGPEAVHDGTLTFRELRRFNRAIYPAVWIPRDTTLSPQELARAAWLWSDRRGVVSGLSASALWGATWIDAGERAEIIHSNRRPPAGLIVRSDTLAPGETTEVSGMPVTDPARTAFDLGRRLTLRAGVQRIDALMSATRVQVADVHAVARQHPGARGLRQLRETLEIVDGGSESPYESLTRLRLVRAGFPRPVTQIKVCDRYGLVLARLDMGWPEYRVAVEFDGAQHWTNPEQRDRDIERHAALEAQRWIVIRVSAGLLHSHRAGFLDRVQAALLSRDCPRFEYSGDDRRY